MRYFNFMAAAVAASTAGAAAHSQAADPTAIENYQLVEEGHDQPTVSKVAAIRSEAMAAIEAGDCETALPLIADWAKQSNILANMIRQGLEPFYGANRDDSGSYSVNNRAEFNELVKAETAANNFTSDRNLAWVKEAECQLKLGDVTAASASAYRALDYISIKEYEAWRAARKVIWEIAEYEVAK